MNKSKRKGTRGENEARDWWISLGYELTDRAPLRGPMDTGDLTGTPFVVSVKYSERWPIWEWLKSLALMVTNDKRRQHGVVQARRNRYPWVFLVPEDTMRALVLAYRHMQEGRWVVKTTEVSKEDLMKPFVAFPDDFEEDDTGSDA